MTENLKTRIWIIIITSDVASSKYYLYIKQGQEYNRLSSSKQPYKLLQDIQNYEKRNML